MIYERLNKSSFLVLKFWSLYSGWSMRLIARLINRAFILIKWSDVYNSYKEWVGEKWDHILIRDVDQDGDMDLIGSVEEHYHWSSPDNKLPQFYFSVVWFENPLK